MREAVCCIVAYHWRRLSTFAKPTFQLNDKLEDMPVFQLKLHTQSIIVVQMAMKFNEAHLVILPGSATASQI
jgi:hypothetical protein